MEEQRVEVSEGELLILDWADLGKEAGDVVFVSCSGQSSGSSAGNQTGESSWAAVSTVRWDGVNVHICHISAQVTKNLVVPGPGAEEGMISDSSEEMNSNEVEDDDSDEDEED